MNSEVPGYDPICGRKIDPTSAESAEYKRKRYYFCSARCKQRFERQAERTRLHDLAKMGALFARTKVRWGLA